MGMKKAVFFTIDALLASGIIIIAVLLVGNFYSQEQQTINVNYASQDLVRVFSTMTVGEVNNDYIKTLITNGEITNPNNTILEQIGDFWANNEIGLAKNLTTNLSDAIIPSNYGFSVLVNGEEIHSRNIPVKRTLVSSRKIISGIAKAKPTEGFTARVLLSGIKSKRTSAYAYFGGYEGDGNLTKKLVLPKDVISFNSSYLEVDAGGNFELYINGFFSGSYAKGFSGGGSMLADKWNLSNAYLANFRAGENIININFISGTPYIAGGFLRVAYVTSSFNDTQTPGYEKYMFPGIDGIINLYSSVYVPNIVNNMQVFLNYSSNYTTYLRLGNTTVYEQGPKNKGFIVPDSSTVLLLHFEEGSGQNADDVSQYNNDGTLGSSSGSDSNDPSWDSSTINGNYALNFDGIDDYVSVSDSNSLDISGPVTVSLWVNINSFAGTASLLSKRNGVQATTNYEIFRSSDTNVYFVIGNGGSSNAVSFSDSNIIFGKWHHIVSTADGSSLKIYLDGNLMSTTPQTISPAANSFSLLIGAMDTGAGPTYFINGIIDEVAVWNTALDAGAIKDIYDNVNTPLAKIKLTNSTLRTLIDYNLFNQKTVPLRMGIMNVTIQLGNTDIILITDVSESMNWRLDSSSTGVTRNCGDTDLYDPSTKRISLAKCLDKQFVDILLNTSSGNTTNRVGLVAYSGLPNSIPTASSTIIRSTHNLSNDNVSLKNQIDSYTPSGATGICGSIRQARTMLEQQSNSSRQKFIVVMTDGIANVQCSPINEYSTTGCVPRLCNDNSFCAGGGCLAQECSDYVSYRASNDSINDACRAYNTTNATVYSIGFGPVSTCSIGNQTLIQIANCGRGSFFASSDANELNKIYSTLAKQILNVTYTAQTINTTSLSKSILYPSSYIAFNYTPLEPQFNKVPLTFETDRFGNNISSGTLTIYTNTSVSDAKVTSYSGSKWTDKLIVNGNTIYRLSDYGNDYTLLGDPFAVNIPTSNINEGSNSITISTGLNSTYSTNGSSDNRVIYTLLLNGFADYSAVVAKSDGCSWNVAFEDKTFSTIKVPSTYSGGDTCSYTSVSKTYDANDALDNPVYQLFSNLDIDKDGKLEFNIDANNLNVNTLTISKVPSLWGPAIIEIRVWE